jgi:5-methyltetrahydrofolate--homocysteine methyltransferase
VTDELTSALVDLREDDALATVDRLLTEGADPIRILEDCKRAMDVIGERFACGEAFIPELVMAGEIMRTIAAKLKPYLSGVPAGPKVGMVVIGTVKGDIHDIGKDIVVTMLDIAGFAVVDLGVDVPAERFVQAVRERRPQIVGLSGLLTVAIEAMKSTIAEIDAAGVRNGVRIMVGGAPITEQVRSYAGADGWGKDAVEAVELARQWVGDDGHVR